MKYNERIFQNTKKTDNIELLLSTFNSLCFEYLSSGHLKKMGDVAYSAIVKIENGKHESDSLGQSMNPYALFKCYFAMSLFSQGKLLEARKEFEDSLQRAEEFGDLLTLCLGESFFGLLLQVLGDFKNAIVHGIRSIEYCEKGQLFILEALMRSHLGSSFHYDGQFEKAWEQMDLGLSSCKEHGSSAAYVYDGLCIHHTDTHELEKALEFAEKGIKDARKYKNTFFEGYLSILKGRVKGMMSVESFESICREFENGMDIVEGFGQKLWHTQGYFFLGEVCLKNHQKDMAYKYLKKARDLFREMNTEYWANKAQGLLDEI